MIDPVLLVLNSLPYSDGKVRIILMDYKSILFLLKYLVFCNLTLRRA